MNLVELRCPLSEWTRLSRPVEGNSEVLERLVTEMYARGLSTRDVEDAFTDSTGELVISKTAVSEVTDRLWEQFEAFCSRDLSDIEVEYLFCDGIYESLRRHGAKEAVLVTWGIGSDGHKHLLHLGVGNKESEADWTELFRHMVRRGLRMPTSVTSDGAPGLIGAIGTVFGCSIRLRCWFHRLADIRVKLPEEGSAEVMAEVRAIRDAPTLDAARAEADLTINRYRREFPAMVACLSRSDEEGTEDLLELRPRTTTTSRRCWQFTGCRCVTVAGYEPPTWWSGPSSKSDDEQRSSPACWTNDQP